MAATEDEITKASQQLQGLITEKARMESEVKSKRAEVEVAAAELSEMVSGRKRHG